MPSSSIREAARQILTAERTPAQQLAIYRESYPDITPQEVAELYPLFLQATAPGQTPEQWRATWTRYQEALKPIRERESTKGGRKIWKTF